jgi:hypothetical protein
MGSAARLTNGLSSHYWIESEADTGGMETVL